MNAEERAVLFKAANEIGRSSRSPGAPVLGPESSRETICRWLQWCDPNGRHLDEMAVAEDMDPYTDESVLEALADMVKDD